MKSEYEKRTLGKLVGLATNRFLVALPFAAMLFVGVKAHLHTDDFQFVTVPPSEEAAIGAYVPYVKAVKEELPHHLAPDGKTAARLAYMWMEAAKQGKLKPVLPCDYTDNSQQGAKLQILSANHHIAEELNWQAMYDNEAGKYKEGADYALLAMQSIRPTQFFDLFSVGNSSLITRNSLTRISEAFPHLSQTERRDILAKLDQVRLRPKELLPLAWNLRRTALTHVVESAQDQSSVATVQTDLNREAFAKLGTLHQAAAWIAAQRFACQTETASDSLRLMYLAYKGAVFTDQRIKDLSHVSTPSA